MNRYPVMNLRPRPRLGGLLEDYQAEINKFKTDLQKAYPPNPGAYGYPPAPPASGTPPYNPSSEPQVPPSGQPFRGNPDSRVTGGAPSQGTGVSTLPIPTAPAVPPGMTPSGGGQGMGCYVCGQSVKWSYGGPDCIQIQRSKEECEKIGAPPGPGCWVCGQNDVHWGYGTSDCIKINRSKEECEKASKNTPPPPPTPSTSSVAPQEGTKTNFQPNLNPYLFSGLPGASSAGGGMTPNLDVNPGSIANLMSGAFLGMVPLRRR